MCNTATECDEYRKAWRSRGYLPHYDAPGTLQLITIRLFDSLPAYRLAELNRRREKLSPLQIRTALEDFYDEGLGACFLRDQRVAQLMQETLLYFDSERYHLLAWVVMPNHVHALAQLESTYPIKKVVHSWKSYTANFGNKLLGRTGQFWEREYFDRYIRNEEHYRNAMRYVEWNPVKAGLAAAPEQWPFSSAGQKSMAEQSKPLC